MSQRRLFATMVLAAMLFVFVAIPTQTHAAEKPLEWKLTFADGNHLLKGHLTTNANDIAKGKTTIHIHGQQPIVIDQNKPNVKATLKGLEEGKTYQGTITFEGVVAGQKVSVYECFTLYAATPGKSLNEKHILKYGECEDTKGNQPGDKPNDGDQPEGDSPKDGDQPKGNEPQDGGESSDQPKDSPQDTVNNPKGGKMPKTATGEPIQLLIGSFLLLAGAVVWKFRGVTQS